MELLITAVYAIGACMLTLGVIYSILTIVRKVAPKTWRAGADWKDYMDHEQDRRDVFKDAEDE